MSLIPRRAMKRHHRFNTLRWRGARIYGICVRDSGLRFWGQEMRRRGEMDALRLWLVSAALAAIFVASACTASCPSGSVLQQGLCVRAGSIQSEAGAQSNTSGATGGTNNVSSSAAVSSGAAAAGEGGPMSGPSAGNSSTRLGSGGSGAAAVGVGPAAGSSAAPASVHEPCTTEAALRGVWHWQSRSLFCRCLDSRRSVRGDRDVQREFQRAVGLRSRRRPLSGQCGQARVRRTRLANRVQRRRVDRVHDGVHAPQHGL